MKLIDKYQRRLNYLRVSITDRCNLRCLYCRPHGMIPKLTHDDVLTYEEILRIIRVGVDLGITKVRVTGGEPLVRSDAVELIKSVTSIPGIQDISLTTNGVLLADRIEDIWAAGVRRLNISLDTLSPRRFRQITGFDFLERVWSGILAAHQMGFSPIKINAVALKGHNEGELTDLAALSLSYPFHIRFIEYMPIGAPEAATDPNQCLRTPDIQTIVSRIGPLTAVAREKNDGPAERFRLPNAKGEVGFISAMTHHFCSTCNRLRLTAAGKLRVCLLSDRQMDLKTPLRNGCSDAELAQLFLKAVSMKPAHHHLLDPVPETVNDAMSCIGG